MRSKRKLIAALVVMSALLAAWVIANLAGQFGWSSYALTTFNSTC